MFAPALNKVNLTKHNIDVFSDRHFYPVNILQPEYSLTTNIVTALNQSWRDPATVSPEEQKKQLITSEFKNIPPITIANPGVEGEKLDAQYDFQSIENMIKKYTGFLPLSPIEDDIKASHADYEELLNLADHQADMRALAKFYVKAIKHLSVKVIDTKNFTNEKLVNSFVRLIPNTLKGRLLTRGLFGRTVKKLRRAPAAIVKYCKKKNHLLMKNWIS